MSATDALAADTVIDLLGLEPLADEGGLWAQTLRDEHSTAIYYLMRPGDFSAMHRLTGTEVWHHYAGASVDMLLLDADGSISRPRLGDDLLVGERPCVVVPSGVWMGAATTGAWSLVGTTMAPRWEPDRFVLGDRARLRAEYPSAADDIDRLTRDRP
ncbi:MAG: cupin domain-containing protein [Ilumatobacteraceae bacterium]